MLVALVYAGLLGLLVATPPGFAESRAITLPPGFEITVFASDLGRPRFMTLDPSGALVVSVPSKGRVVALPDPGGRGKADTAITVVDGLQQPHGLAFRQGYLYVAETGRVVRFRYDPATFKATGREVIVPSLPHGSGHWQRTVVFGPDDRMYVSVGSSCNICRESDRRRAAVVRYSPDGSGEELFATGLRNAVGLAIDPRTGSLWATVNERDWRGDDVPPDYITELVEHGFYGWPDCMVVRGQILVDERFARRDGCPPVTRPTIEIQAHSAPLGLAFYTGRQFPPEYRGDLFVAYHGSWNRSVPTGYKIARVRFKEGKPAGVEDFATGWLYDGRVSGRPVDLVVGRDGALYVSDDSAGQIDRIVYRASP